MRIKLITIIVLLFVLTSACMSESGRIDKANKALGSKRNPIKMYFVPSLEAGKVVASGEAIAKALQAETGYYFKVAVPTSYAAVIEALGSYQADIAWLPTFAYVLAKQKYDAEVKFMTVRNGLKQYRGQFVARADSPIKTIEDIQGKVVAYTDAASTSGYIYPSAMLKEQGIEPSQTRFTGSHNAAILAVYSGTADVGCTYWSPPDSSGLPKDAREKLLDTKPDVLEKIIPIAFTDWIPNDTVTFRKNMPQELEAKVVKALSEFAASAKGGDILRSLYDIDGLQYATDADYDVVRKTLQLMKLDPSSFLN
ncbi:MAG TPA: phosphate/phosphite/phosphonate ABC transporter substrate-binding protein [Candidatus Cloacimonadota bacterium]|nr:phosphate/phosphite/phosphonate ABC transporter substrate-binding protein [Candidatus Cloacimonadota bacterium]HOH79554.1 phosphate/phosphite/phosphonate ABC transporter substrate-binding protein [Candidatus Cloacimonadota bacterium]